MFLAPLAMLCILGTGTIDLRPLFSQDASKVPPQDPARDAFAWERGTPPGDGHLQRRVLETLWQARAYTLATEYCRTYRSMQSTTTDPYAQWTIWWLETLGRQWLDQRDERTALESEIKTLLEAYLLLDTPREPWIALQGVRLEWMRCSAGLQRSLASPADRRLHEQVIASLREPMDRLERMTADVQTLVAKTSRANSKGNAIPFDEMQGLANELVLMKIDFLLIRCQAYPLGSNDAIGAANQLLEAIEAAQLRIASDWSGIARLNLARARAHYFLAEWDLAIANAAAGLDRSGEWNLQPKFYSLMIDAKRMQKKFEEARKELQTAGGWMRAPELALAELELMLAECSSHLASQSEIPKKDLQQLIDFRRQLGNRYGQYWEQRADLALLRVLPADAAARSQPSVQLELIHAEIKQWLKAGKWDKARDRLIAGEAAASNDPELAIQLGLEAAALEKKFGSTSEAAKYLRAASLRAATSSKAPAAHWTAYWMQEQTRADVASSEDATSLAMLTEHLATWPQADTSTDAYRELDRYWLRHQDRESILQAGWGPAIEQAPHQPTRHAALLGRMLHEVLLARHGWPDQSKLAIAIVNQHAQEVPDSAKEIRTLYQLASRLSQDARWVPIDPQPTNPWELRPSWSDQSATPHPLAHFLSQLAANQPLDLASLDPFWEQDDIYRWWLWPLAEQVLERGYSLSLEQRKSLAVPLLNLSELVAAEAERSNVAKVVMWRSALMCLHATAWNGSLEEAAAMMQQVRTDYPKNPDVELELGMFLASMGKHEDALQTFRQLAQGTRIGNAIWLEARGRSAWMLRQLGKESEARQLIQVLQASQPDFPPHWKLRLERLAR